MTPTEHHPVVSHWYRTGTSPEEIYVACTCGRFEFTSQESISGPVESWAGAWEEHLEETDQL